MQRAEPIPCEPQRDSVVGAVHRGLHIGDRLHPIQHIWSSMPEKAALRRNAYLFSSAVTYGYSPYSRKLGPLVLPDELHKRLRALLPIRREPFEIGEHGRDAGLAEQPHGQAGSSDTPGQRPRSIAK